MPDLNLIQSTEARLHYYAVTLECRPHTINTFLNRDMLEEAVTNFFTLRHSYNSPKITFTSTEVFVDDKKEGSISIEELNNVPVIYY